MEKFSRKRFPRQIQKIMCSNISIPTQWKSTSVYFYDIKERVFSISLNEDSQHCPYAKKKRKRPNNDMDAMMLMILLN